MLILSIMLIDIIFKSDKQNHVLKLMEIMLIKTMLMKTMLVKTMLVKIMLVKIILVNIKFDETHMEEKLVKQSDEKLHSRTQ